MGRFFMRASFVVVLIMVMDFGGLQAAFAQTAGDQALLRQMQSLIDQEKWDETIALCDEIADLDAIIHSTLYAKGYAQYRKGEYTQSILTTLKATEYPQVRHLAWYNIACIHVKLENTDEAFAALDRAVINGFDNMAQVQSDPDLEPLHDDPRWAKLPGVYDYQSMTLTDGTVIECVLVLPENYDASKTYPMLIGMPPGDGSRGPTNGALRWWWGNQAARAGWIVAVILRPPSWVTDRGVQIMKELLDDFEGQYNIEGGKFHIAGCSGGGASAFHIAMAFPERFHSLTAMPANPNHADIKRLERLKNMKVRLHVGEYDSNWSNRMQQVYERLQGLDVDVTFTIHPGERHQIQGLRGPVLMELMEGLRSGELGKGNGE